MMGLTKVRLLILSDPKPIVESRVLESAWGKVRGVDMAPVLDVAERFVAFKVLDAAMLTTRYLDCLPKKSGENLSRASHVQCGVPTIGRNDC